MTMLEKFELVNDSINLNLNKMNIYCEEEELKEALEDIQRVCYLMDAIGSDAWKSLYRRLLEEARNECIG